MKPRALAPLLALAACSSQPPPAPVPAPPTAPLVIGAASAPPQAVAQEETPLAVASSEPPMPTMTSGPCSPKPPKPPPLRRGGDLIVESPPRAEAGMEGGRLRAQIKGALSKGSQRTWIGPDVPPFVFLVGGTRELFLLEEAPDGYFAFYRDPYDAGSCSLSGSANCSFGVAFFECSGNRRWLFLLNPHLSRPDHLEVQDIRYDQGIVYFNEACQTYAREAGGKCSSLVALDPVAEKVLWRTPPLVSNNEFLISGQYIITGYGFTAEPDYLAIVRKSDGKVMQRISIPSSHDGFTVEADGTLTVSIYYKKEMRFRMEGFEGEKPRLVKIAGPSPEPRRQKKLPPPVF